MSRTQTQKKFYFTQHAQEIPVDISDPRWPQTAAETMARAVDRHHLEAMSFSLTRGIQCVGTIEIARISPKFMPAITGFPPGQPGYCIDGLLPPPGLVHDSKSGQWRQGFYHTRENLVAALIPHLQRGQAVAEQQSQQTDTLVAALLQKYGQPAPTPAPKPTAFPRRDTEYEAGE